MLENRIVVVGATGYIGSHIIKYSRPHLPIIGTNTTGRNGMTYFTLEEPNEFTYEVLREGDTVLFTAAISAPDICAKEYSRVRRVNVDGTSTFIQNALRRGVRVVFFSSDAVYGESVDTVDESAKCSPTGEYAEMKYEVENEFLGSPLFKTIRLSYVFSKDDKFCKYLTGCVARDVTAEVFHPFYRAIVHRSDIVDGALALAVQWDDVPEQIVNFGGPEVLSRLDFAQCLRDTSLHSLRLQVSEPDSEFFKGRPRVINMSSPVFERVLGRKPRSLYEAARIEFPPS